MRKRRGLFVSLFVYWRVCNVGQCCNSSHALYARPSSVKLSALARNCARIHVPCACTRTGHILMDTSHTQTYTNTTAADMMVSIVAEAIIHEYMESFGLSHHHAVISELQLGADTRHPQRISYQLANMSGNGLLGVRSHFGNAIKREAALLVSVSTKWTQGWFPSHFLCWDTGNQDAVH